MSKFWESIEVEDVGKGDSLVTMVDEDGCIEQFFLSEEEAKDLRKKLKDVLKK